MKWSVPFVYYIAFFYSLNAVGQRPPSYTSSEIYQHIEKLGVLGSVLYIAAHPDDENTRLLAYLSKGRLLRTGYLSLTRGDGGQNLIGGEQGIELGLLRTQELLAARRIDGAEQFFTRAYDFGYSKNTEEALAVWNKEKILSDVVWVIRTFKPDVIITRFPDDNRAGHGHHSASAALAREAFAAAADGSRFPGQIKQGALPWQASRLLWNTYIFGENNTIRPDQMKIDVGGFNPLLGKSYGEISAESRSQHKSQGFGAASGRGIQYEYFTHLGGSPARLQPDDGLDKTWKRVGAPHIDRMISQILQQFRQADPRLSVPRLVDLYKTIRALPASVWKDIKMKELQRLIESCSGLWLEAYSNAQFAVQGNAIKIYASANARSGSPAVFTGFSINRFDTAINTRLETNSTLSFPVMLDITDTLPVTQPYWLKEPMEEGSYNVYDQLLIGKPGPAWAFTAAFKILIGGETFIFEKQVMYKHTDPVKGELYQPMVVLPPVNVSLEPEMVLINKRGLPDKNIVVQVRANRHLDNYKISISQNGAGGSNDNGDTSFSLHEGRSRNYVIAPKENLTNETKATASITLLKGGQKIIADKSLHNIRYDHIPDIFYFRKDSVNLMRADLQIAGSRIGYIEGAGDKLPAALRLMGYDVTLLNQQDLDADILRGFDAVITGVRAYNVHSFLSEKNEALNTYIKNGGNLIVQYNTNNDAGPSRALIGPYKFHISRTRVTDEGSPVHFVDPGHPVLNYPNKITASDFENWKQERGIYFADELAPEFEAPLSMNDPGEEPHRGSLIIASYGKGKFVYTGLAFFRELPAGIPGAYRLLANIIALNKSKVIQ